MNNYLIKECQTKIKAMVDTETCVGIDEISLTHKTTAFLTTVVPLIDKINAKCVRFADFGNEEISPADILRSVDRDGVLARYFVEGMANEKTFEQVLSSIAHALGLIADYASSGYLDINLSVIVKIARIKLVSNLASRYCFISGELEVSMAGLSDHYTTHSIRNFGLSCFLNGIVTGYSQYEHNL